MEKAKKMLPFVTSLIWSFYAFGFGTVQNILLKFVVRRIIIFMKQKVSNTRNHLQKCWCDHFSVSLRYREFSNCLPPYLVTTILNHQKCKNQFKLRKNYWWASLFSSLTFKLTNLNAADDKVRSLIKCQAKEKTH